MARSRTALSGYAAALRDMDYLLHLKAASASLRRGLTLEETRVEVARMDTGKDAAHA